MEILKAYKTELNPNNKQRTMMRHCCGAARYVFNWGLAEWKRQYEANEKPSGYKLCKEFNAQKDDLCPWVRELPYVVTEAAFWNLNAAFQNFFRRIKNDEDKPGYPKFKRRGNHNSFQLRDTRIEHNRVRLTRIGWVRLKEHGYIPTSDTDTKFGTYTTIMNRAGRWYCSVLIIKEIPDPDNDSTLGIGIDLGLKSRAVFSNGKIFEIPRILDEYKTKRHRLQRELARRSKGGSNWRKTKRKLARIEAKIADTRGHWQHQISHYATEELKPKIIVLENLNVSGMLKNHRLSRAISDAGFYEIRRQIEYKARWNGIEVVIADRWYPSSKTCSECGAVNPLLKLSDRLFICPGCGVIIDRDLNAAMNLASLAS